MMDIETKLKNTYLTALMGVIFAVVGFAYNTWRLEVTEDNNNIRTACFEVFKELAELEQIIYAHHYDNDTVNGNARTGWVKVGLIVDLSSLINADVSTASHTLKVSWQDKWHTLGKEQATADKLITNIDNVRTSLKTTLSQLR